MILLNNTIVADKSGTKYTITHSKDGNTHSLAGMPTGGGVMPLEFKATAVFNANDIFEGYTIKTLGDNTPLPTNYFIIDDIVTFMFDTSTKIMTFPYNKYAPDGFGIGEGVTFVTDFNNVSGTGFFRSVGGGSENSPNKSYSWYLEHIQHDSADNALQKATRISSTNPDVYTRQKLSGTWGAWAINQSTMFAPAGYGLGDIITRSKTGDLDTIQETALFGGDSASLATQLDPDGVGGPYMGMNLSWGANNKMQLFADVNVRGSLYMRKYQSGTWYDVEEIPTKDSMNSIPASKELSKPDLNTIIIPGLYGCSDWTNGPSGLDNDGLLIVYKRESLNAPAYVQIVYPDQDNAENLQFAGFAIRSRETTTSVWRPWKVYSANTMLNTYSSLSQLGLTQTSTMVQVCTALPDDSMIVYRVYPSDTSVYPIGGNNSQFITIKKHEDYAVITAQSINSSNPRVFNAVWSTSSGFMGWKEVVSTTNIGTYAAPAGFGLGGIAKYVPDGNWNNITDTGWYMYSSGTNAPSTGWYIGHAVAHADNWVTLTVWPFSDSNRFNSVWKRQKNNGTWGAWIRDVKVSVQSAQPTSPQTGDLWIY